MFRAIKSWFKSIDTFEVSAIIFIFLGIGVIALAFIIGKWNNITFMGGTGHILDYSEFVGSLIGSFWALAGVLLFYASLTSQKSELEAQRGLLVKQINEVVAQTKEFRIQNEMNKKQKNEDTFFQLLRFHNEIISAITLDVNEMDFATGKNVAKTISGRKTFVEYYDIYKRFFQEASEMMPIHSKQGLAKLFDKSYSSFYAEYQSELGHYFRNLFNIIKYINSLEDEDQAVFLRLLYAQLSNYELTMLFFHCLRSTEYEYKTLVEENTLLDSVPKDEVTSMAHVLFDSKAFGKSGFGSGEDFEEKNAHHTEGFATSQGDDSTSKSEFGSFDDILGRLKKVDNSENEEVKEDFVIEDNDDGGGLDLASFFDEENDLDTDKADEIIDEITIKKQENEASEEMTLNDFFSEEDTESSNDGNENLDLDSLKSKVESFGQNVERKKLKDELEKKMQTDEEYEKMKAQLSGMSETESIIIDEAEELENIIEFEAEKPNLAKETSVKRRLKVKVRNDDKKGNTPSGKGFLSKM